MTDYRNRPPVDAPRRRFPEMIDLLELAGICAAIIAAGLILFVLAAVFLPA